MTKIYFGMVIHPPIDKKKVKKFQNDEFFIFRRPNSDSLYDRVSIRALSPLPLEDELIVQKFEELFAYLGEEYTLNGMIEICQGKEGEEKKRFVQVTEKIEKKDGKRITQKSVQVFDSKPNNHKRSKTVSPPSKEQKTLEETYTVLNMFALKKLHSDTFVIPNSRISKEERKILEDADRPTFNDNTKNNATEILSFLLQCSKLNDERKEICKAKYSDRFEFGKWKCYSSAFSEFSPDELCVYQSLKKTHYYSICNPI